MWDVDTIDWRPVADGGPTAYQIASKVRTNAVSGSDVLMHLGGWNTREALPYMVEGLRARGLRPTSLSEMLRRSAGSAVALESSGASSVLGGAGAETAWFCAMPSAT
jgi:hypothetical protein